MNIKNAILSAAAALAAISASAYEGTVYRDTNANGRRDVGEPAMKGVRVSDGLNVAVTGADGRFSLPGYDRTRFIFITTPSGFKTYNRHYIQADENTSSYDFGLIPYKNGADSHGEHSFIQVTDTEISKTEGNEAWTDDLRRYAAAEHPAFIIHTGDICYPKGLKAHIELMNTANMGVPVYYVIGNHDLVVGDYGEQLFEQLYGPVYYSFDAGNTHYVVTPMAGGDYAPSYDSDQVAAWLENDLANTDPSMSLVVFNHDLLTGGDRFVYGGKNKRIDLNAHNLRAWIYGHLHINHKRSHGEGVYSMCTSTPDKGGIDHSTSAYRVVKVGRDGSHATQLRYSYIHNSVVIASPKGATASDKVIVNAYSSVAETESVSYTLIRDGKKRAARRPLTRRTDFAWEAPLDAKSVKPGEELTLEVTARFSDGSVGADTVRFAADNSGVEVRPGAAWDNLAGNAAHSGGVTDARLDSSLILVRACNVGGNIFMTSPLIHGGKAITATVDEEMTGGAAVCAVDMATGAESWRFATGASVKNTIAIDSGLVFAQDVNGTLYAIDCGSGRLRWKAEMPVAAVPALVEGLAATDGVVYAGSGKALTAFDAATGRIIWRNSEWSRREGTTSTLAAGDGVVVGSVQWDALYGNDSATGRLLWRHSDFGLRHRGASAAIHRGLIYILSEKSIFVIEARTGRIVFRKQLPVAVDATSTPLLTENRIVFGTSANGLMALDNKTFEPVWQTDFGRAMIFTTPYTRPEASTVETTPLLAGGIVWVAASDGVVYGVDEKTGRIVWSYTTGAPSFSSVAASGNSLVATDFGGTVYIFAAPGSDSAGK